MKAQRFLTTTRFQTIILEEGGGRGPYGAKGMGEGTFWQSHRRSVTRRTTLLELEFSKCPLAVKN